jgi:hypothetical protein
VAVEEMLDTELDSSIGFVDGHDFGSGETNLFVQTNEPRSAFDAAAACLSTNARWAAVRPLNGEPYNVSLPSRCRPSRAIRPAIGAVQPISRAISMSRHPLP